MYLRRLEAKDAPYMLEWMHDKAVVEHLHADFSSKRLSDAEAFIQKSWAVSNHLHLAITSNEDEYIGTVSLKYIDDETAEFAITIRSIAMGKGYSWFGMSHILEKAFNELHLKCVYWCVSRNNRRAICFYEKHHFKEAVSVPTTAKKRYMGIDNLMWYSTISSESIACNSLS